VDAHPLDILDADSRSALTSASMPSAITPMLATLAHDPFSDDGWLFERKLDGERCIALVGGDHGVSLLSRSQQPLDDTYPEVVDALAGTAAPPLALDGEVVAFDGNVTSFQRLQGRIGITDPEDARASGVPVFYYIFDVLHVDGFDTTAVPLRKRKILLTHCLTFADPLRFTPHRNGSGEEYHRQACDSGWEGLIAKDADSVYVSRRSRSWLKLKCVNRQELVIGGFTEPQGSRHGFGALIVGYYADDTLCYAGKVGTGFDDSTLSQLGTRLRELEISQSPFADGPDDDSHWVEPILVGEFGFTEWTEAGLLRHPRYLGLRDDKPAEEVVRET
jgi:bifunctional non-homologous end joining protein LigD